MKRKTGLQKWEERYARRMAVRLLVMFTLLIWPWIPGLVTDNRAVEASLLVLLGLVWLFAMIVAKAWEDEA